MSARVTHLDFLTYLDPRHSDILRPKIKGIHRPIIYVINLAAICTYKIEFAY